MSGFVAGPWRGIRSTASVTWTVQFDAVAPGPQRHAGHHRVDDGSPAWRAVTRRDELVGVGHATIRRRRVGRVPATPARGHVGAVAARRDYSRRCGSGVHERRQRLGQAAAEEVDSSTSTAGARPEGDAAMLNRAWNGPPGRRHCRSSPCRTVAAVELFTPTVAHDGPRPTTAAPSSISSLAAPGP